MINPELFNFTVVTENKFKRQNGEAVMAGFFNVTASTWFSAPNHAPGSADCW
jgi:hypothetical protein